MFNKKGNGLSEEQRKQMRLIEKEQEEIRKRLEKNADKFKEDYMKYVVEPNKMKHVAYLEFMPGVPDYIKQMVGSVARPVLRIADCTAEVEAIEKERNKAVVPSD